MTDITDLAVTGYIKRARRVYEDAQIGPTEATHALVYVEIAKMIQREEAAMSAVREGRWEK